MYNGLIEKFKEDIIEFFNDLQIPLDDHRDDNRSKTALKMKCTDIDINELYKKSMFELGYVDFILKALNTCLDLYS